LALADSLGERHMGWVAGKAGARSAWPKVVTFLAVVLGAAPVAAQVRPNDVRLTTALDISYAIDPKWRLDVFSEMRLDQNINRLADLVLRPNIQYAFLPNWTIAAGYVQFEPLQATFRTERGAFEDLFYRTGFGALGVTNRLRLNETFADQSSAMLVFTSYLLALRHPIGESAWFAALSDEVFFNLKVDGTGRQAGFQRNKSYVGVGYPVDQRVSLTAGYELAVDDIRGTLFTAHTIKFGAGIKLN
jgi:Protein of unknown function (DUF2490)